MDEEEEDGRRSRTNIGRLPLRFQRIVRLRTFMIFLRRHGPPTGFMMGETESGRVVTAPLRLQEASLSLLFMVPHPVITNGWLASSAIATVMGVLATNRSTTGITRPLD
eukprot:GHVU01202183.1.p5 GENE.GHVU01202183.1~~GHVU01202183.1.p5  ORF type:complete len:109 (+),score=10.11 GHVU01202183.1:1805-2131(+)